jgi:hypothetical protein
MRRVHFHGVFTLVPILIFRQGPWCDALRAFLRSRGGRAARMQGGRAAGRQGGRAARMQGGRAAGRQGGRAAGRQGGRAAGRQGGQDAGRQGGRAARMQGGRAARMQGGQDAGRHPTLHRKGPPRPSTLILRSSIGSTDPSLCGQLCRFQRFSSIFVKICEIFEKKRRKRSDPRPDT